ncbi:MAG: bifunctional phosphoribosyl-AMP cyclohydrolase/phosphoribosyl-ATP diphosphatase HisIE [Bacilli bacterium]|nr:bifunctional phosphoribosyl-AMP cyclohydrolase/phosphoribosyl-ATP diphosphatase HisIE [Bacilli bacterium]
MDKKEFLSKVKYDDKGLVLAISQDFHSKKVRMVAYMNKESLEKTLETNQVYYFSRSRNKLWLKGETSGYYQYLKGISVDCDGDALLLQIEQQGGISCHTGAATCFYQELTENVSVIINREKASTSEDALTKLYEVIIDRKKNPKEGSYTNYLFDKGIDKILKKIGEESSEVIIAAKDKNKEQVVFEISDLIYHLSVLMAEFEITWDDVKSELDKR